MSWWDDPVLYMLVFAFFAAWSRRPILVKTLLIVFAVISLTPLSMWLVKSLEGEPQAAGPVVPRGVVVILTGGTVHYFPSREQYAWSWAVDRATEGIRFFKKGAAPILMVTGTERVQDGREREIDSIARLAREWGVADSSLILEDKATNTYENAKLAAEILKQKGISDFYLVTSAFHMPRARRCFEKQGLAPVPYPVDFAGIPEGWRQWTATPGRRWALLSVFFHEAIGMAWYWIKGAI